MTRGPLCAAILVAACGCERDAPLIDAAQIQSTPAAAGGAAAAGPATDAPKLPEGVKNLGRGRKPYRGPVQVLPPGSLPVEFEPAEMDFGVLAPGDSVYGRSRIWNNGDTPLKIVKSITSCGCTAAEDLAGREIPPGGSIEFSTTMRMKSGLGDKKEKITVYFAGDTERVAIQYYVAEVSLPVRITPPHLSASSYEDNRWVQIPTGEISVSSIDGKPFRVLSAHGHPPVFVGFDPDRDEPRSAYTIKWDIGIFGDGTIPWFWVLETDRPDCPVIDVRLRHSSTLPTRTRGRPWVSIDQRVLVGEVYRGVPFEITTKLEYNKGRVPDPSRVAVVSESGDLSAELLEVQADGQFLQYRIKITPASHVEPGLLYGMIAVSASGFDTPLTIIGRVVD